VELVHDWESVNVHLNRGEMTVRPVRSPARVDRSGSLKFYGKEKRRYFGEMWDGGWLRFDGFARKIEFMEP